MHTPAATLTGSAAFRLRRLAEILGLPTDETAHLAVDTLWTLVVAGAARGPVWSAEQLLDLLAVPHLEERADTNSEVRRTYRRPGTGDRYTAEGHLDPNLVLNVAATMQCPFTSRDLAVVMGRARVGASVRIGQILLTAGWPSDGKLHGTTLWEPANLDADEGDAEIDTSDGVHDQSAGTSPVEFGADSANYVEWLLSVAGLTGEQTRVVASVRATVGRKPDFPSDADPAELVDYLAGLGAREADLGVLRELGRRWASDSST